MADDEMRDAYSKSHANIVKYLVAGASEPDPPDDAKKLDSKKYEDTLAAHLEPVLQEIDNQLERKYKDKHVEIKKAIIQCNSLHPKVNARLRIPWKMSEEDWKFTRSGETPEILCLHPDRPTHILTEILLRLKPYPNQESADGSRKDWVGILLNTDANIELYRKAEDEYYLCLVAWSDEIDINTFSKSMRDRLETFRKMNKQAMVALGKEYPPPEKFHCVTERVFKWFKRHEKTKNWHEETRNAFYLADLVDSEQLAGIAAELEIGEKTKISDVNDFLKDCQWMMNRYVFSLILEVEKTYSGEGPSYPDAYFSYTDAKEDGKKVKRYGMIEDLIEVFTPYDEERNNGNNFNKRYKNCKFNNMGIIENLFRKIRIHFEITKGEMGKYAIGYKKHAYEVACVVAGIMDVLFYDEPDSAASIETIVRQCSPGLEGIEKQLEDKKVPFLFRQLFKGLSKEDQLFLIPQYREHFIHSFYVFVFGVSLMSYAPVHVIPKKLQLNELDDENKVKGLLKEWFMVSMWHDIAYMIEKGNMVLEQHVLSLMRKGRREKGLLPWLPSLGNLMQADNLLSEIRDLSKGSIELCSDLINGIKPEALRRGIKEEDVVPRLVGDIVIAAAFERRDHGVWSAMMFNHAWDSDMSKLYFPNGGDDEALRKKISMAIIPHHLADWDVREMLKDYDYVRDLSKDCTTQETIQNAAEALLSNKSPSPANCVYRKDCMGEPVTKLLPLNDRGPLNEMGYLLGLCDMISQAGRENAELPTETGSNWGILYEEIHNKPHGILSLVLKYTQKPVTRELFRDRYVRPALFLGLTVCDEEKSNCDGIKITIKSGTMANKARFFYHPSLYRESK